jgi:poly [ADP-ribose] polymerase
MKKVYKVVNNKTQVKFDKNLEKASVKKKRLYWHGSRNENWFNILQTGLLIRPSGAVHTGSMFGDGIYFADKAQKSIGYTSLRGSYWAHGGDNKAFLALFDVLIQFESLQVLNMIYQHLFFQLLFLMLLL